MSVAGGVLLVKALENQGVARVFCVPGESYLPVLDALHDSPVETVVCRQEGGAAMMAEADGKLTGRPGIAFVTRGPGATNASAGVHVAAHDRTPMILFVGQVPKRFRGRGAFQEVDYDRFFGGMAKAVFEAENADALPGIVEEAYRIALGPAPGPVVVALPENTLSGPTAAAAPDFVEAPSVEPDAAAMEALGARLAEAERPVVILGGPRWTREAVDDIAAFAADWRLPVVCSFRRQVFPTGHPSYAGDLGLGVNPALATRIAEADLVLAIGARLGEVPSQGYTLFAVPEPRQRLVHVLPDAAAIGRLYRPALGIAADPVAFARALRRLAPTTVPVWAEQTPIAHEAYLAWSTPQPEATPAGTVDMFAAIAALRDALPADAIVTNGAGNYAAWAHRFLRQAGFGNQLAPTSGSMGYGLPAAVAAKLRFPERAVVALAGDGCFQMTGQEFGTAVQAGAAVVVIVFDNGQYGTIRMHQERHYPGRVSGTGLVNPDFAALARAYGARAERVERTEDFAPALRAALAAGEPALLHVVTDPARISPSTRYAPAEPR
ncbi:thiamine pyrophosphate-dependent enzyme [Antarcticirhabdus aurantiaca]|uniref:Thiamine pyrophosphate-binding protein n=1 Tax=Antarcticirhabdus aurantiaca TaxID=2606717 RepID=A0ACD4NTE0_9HYPH|nr:thiamine pyrophosphate-dependent enzyme [Antarcticirhabdus aurantiaca]WAJ30039.1 thiamine pyrophosphate-binding protein [Jeongeuplla avenae]